MSQKIRTQDFCWYLPQMITDFKNLCSDKFNSKYLILRSENSDNLKHIVINNKSQGSVAAHLRCGGLFSYHFTMYLSLSLILIQKLISVNTWQNYRLKGWLVLCACLPWLFCWMIKNWPDNLAMMDINCFCSCCVTMQNIFDFNINRYHTNKYFYDFLSGLVLHSCCTRSLSIPTF